MDWKRAAHAKSPMLEKMADMPRCNILQVIIHAAGVDGEGIECGQRVYITFVEDLEASLRTTYNGREQTHILLLN